MPLPICPAPITPTFLILPAISLQRPETLLRRTAACAKFPTAELFLRKFVAELRERLEQIGDEPVIGDLEERRLSVLVDRYDHLRILHPGEMLNGAGNADREIKLGRHHLAGLPDLPVVRRVAGIDRRPRSADGGAELVGHRFDVF